MTSLADLNKSKRLLLSMGAGALSAALVTMILAGNIVGSFLFIILSYFATLPLFLVGFTFDTKSLGIAAATSTALVLLLTISGPSTLLVTFTYIFWNILPVLWICFYTNLNKKHPNLNGELMYQLALYAVGLLIIIKYLPGFGGDNIIDMNAMNKAMETSKASKADVQQVLNTIKLIIPYLSGFMISSWLLMITFNWFLANKILPRIIPNLPAIKRDFTLPKIYIAGLACLGTIGSIFSGQNFGLLAINISVILLIPCFLSGISIVNLIAKNKGINKLMLGVFYVFMLFFPILIIFVLLLGIFEPWLHLRNKFVKVKIDLEN